MPTTAMPASITLTVSHLATSTSFFLSCLQPLNYVYRGRVDNTIGFGLPDAAPDFWITQSIPGVPPGPAHVAFPAVSHEMVHKFFLAAIKAGAKVHGEPALRDIQSGYYSAAVIDLDNNSIEAVYRPDILETSKSVVSGAKSATSAAPKTVIKSKAPSTAPSQARSLAPSASTRSTVSKSQTNISAKIPSASPRSTVSKAASQASSQATIKPQQVASTAQRNGDSVSDFISEAKGTLNVARDLVNSVSGGSKDTKSSSPDSHGPSDAIVGTLLGVAAGAALYYTFSSRKKPGSESPEPVTPYPGIARSETAPTYPHRQQYRLEDTQPYLAIEGNPSTYSQISERRRIDMVDNNPVISEYTSTTRTRRRSSISGPVPSQLSAARTATTNTTTRSRKLLEAPPPTSYRTPTALTENRSQTSHKSRSRSSSMSRATQPRGQRQDEGYASASESKPRSHISRRSSIKSKSTPTSRRQSPETDRGQEKFLSGSVISALRKPSIIDGSVTLQKHHHHSSHSNSPSEVQSYHTSKTQRSQRTSAGSVTPKSEAKVIGKLTRKQLEKLEDGGRGTDITRSVISKVKDVDQLDLSGREVRPEDSVSQVSSNPSRKSRRSKS